jgi:hypothetical protein
MKICVLGIKDIFQNYSIICVHAPTEDKSELEKDHFYEQVHRTYTQCPSHDTNIITGGFNATAGNESWVATAYMMKAMVMECVS